MKSNIWTWVIVFLAIIAIIAATRYFARQTRVNALTSQALRERPTSCPKGYVLHKGHCVRVLGEDKPE